MVSTSFPRDAADWQGRFIYDMARHVAARRGLALSLWAPPGELPSRVHAAATQSESDWLAGMALRGGIAQILRRERLSGLITASRLMAQQWVAYRRLRPDLFHVNWLQNAVALGRTATPALITVLGSDLGLMRLPGMRTALRTVLSVRRAMLAPNAEWMVGPLRKAFGDIARIEAVPFGVAPEWFGVERSPAAASKDWLVVSRVTRGKIGDLLGWGEGLFGETRQLHLFGPMQESVALPPWVRYHGPTYPEALREEWFPRATGLLTLSRHDEGRPQVLIEAMAAGLPVIGSAIAAHADLIRHGETGWLAADRAALANALTAVEAPESAARVGLAARRFVKENFGTWEDCARRYGDAYRMLMET